MSLLDAFEGVDPKVLQEMVQDHIAQTRKGVINGDEVRHHSGDETYMVIPKAMTYAKANKILSMKEQEANEMTSFSRTFLYRYHDGLVATAHVMKDMFGMTMGKAILSFFGKRPPEMATVKISHSETIQVPCGLIAIPGLDDSEVFLGQDHHREYGSVYAVNFQGPRKHKEIIELFFKKIDRELAINSIYRGKALTGADQLEFLDLSSFDPNRIVFSDEVTDVLQNAVFAPIEKTDAFIQENIPLKRAVLFYGPYGTGKSSAGQIIGQKAEQNNWTFLLARTGKDKVQDVLKTARLYEPCVVFIEDIDTQAKTGDPMEVARLLDAFDGITAKDSKLMLVMTSNHVEDIHKGMLRPGRLDFVTEVKALDRQGIEKLIRVVVGDAKLDKNVDFDVVFAQMQGFEPAFVRAVADRAKTWAVSRTGGGSYVLTTEDLAGAARSLHSQLALLNAANEGEPAPSVDSTLRELLGTTMRDDLRIADRRGSEDYDINRFIATDKDKREN